MPPALICNQRDFDANQILDSMTTLVFFELFVLLEIERSLLIPVELLTALSNFNFRLPVFCLVVLGLLST